jgi:hypothetical protein
LRLTAMDIGCLRMLGLALVAMALVAIGLVAALL